MRFLLFHGIALLLTLTCQPALFAQDDASTTWIVDGKKLEAEFVRLADDGVVLRRMSDQREGEIPFSRLDFDGRLQAIQLGRPNKFPRLRARAAPSMVPSRTLSRSPVDIDVDLQSPFSSSQTIEQFLEVAKREIASGNYFAAWHALSPTIQDDIRDLIVKGVENAGSTGVVQFRILINDINQVISTKEEFILNHPHVTRMPMVARTLRDNWPLVKAYSASLSDKRHWQKENFQEGNVIPWLAQVSATLGSHHNELVSSIDQMTGGKATEFLDVDFEITNQSARSADVKTTLPPPFEKQTFGRVRNAWVIQDAATIRAFIDQSQAQTDSTSGIARTILSAAIAVVGGLKRADSQTKFNAAVTRLEQLFQQGATAAAPSTPRNLASRWKTRTAGPVGIGKGRKMIPDKTLPIFEDFESGRIGPGGEWHYATFTEGRRDRFRIISEGPFMVMIVTEKVYDALIANKMKSFEPATDAIFYDESDTAVYQGEAYFPDGTAIFIIMNMSNKDVEMRLQNLL